MQYKEDNMGIKDYNPQQNQKPIANYITWATHGEALYLPLV